MKIYYKKKNKQIAMISENDLSHKQFEVTDYNLSDKEWERIKNKEAVFYRDGKLEFESSDAEIRKKAKEEFRKKVKEGNVKLQDIVEFLDKF